MGLHRHERHAVLGRLKTIVTYLKEKSINVKFLRVRMVIKKV
jgi:hypothetical protein